MSSDLTRIPGSSSIDFEKIFEVIPGNHLIVKSNSPMYTIMAASLGHLQSTGKQKKDVVGKNIFDVFGENPLKNSGTGVIKLRESFEKISRTKAIDHLPVIRYDVINGNGRFEERYWTASNTPLLDDKGEILYILHSSTELTEKIKAEKDGNELKGIKANFNLFMQAPVAVCIVHGSEYVVELANESMLHFLGRTSEIVGRPIIESLPEAEKQGLIAILDKVRATGEKFAMSGFPAEILINGIRESLFFDLAFTPFYPNSHEAEVTSIFCVAHNVTEQVLARKKAEESEQQLRSFVEATPFPIGIYVGREMRIQFVNQSIVDTWGKGKDVVGKLYAEVLPELEDSGIYAQLDNVYTSGVAFSARNQQVDLVVDGKLQPFFFNYDFTPLFNAEGQVYGVMNTAADVTDLKLANNKIEESEQSLRNIIRQAPVAMCIFRGKNFVVEVANNSMFEFWGKTPEEVMNKPIFEGIPEAKNQGYEDLMNSVLETGKPFNASELPVNLIRNGVLQTVYINFTYQPISEVDGSVSSIMAMAVDVTEQVITRKKIEENITELQLAVEIADLGTFRIDLLTNIGSYSSRVKDWFGFTESETNMDEIILQVHPDDRQKVSQALQKTLKSEIHSYHDITYRIINNKEQWMKHLRSLGRTFYDDEGIPYLIIGTIQDVTPQMEYQEQLKNSEAELQKRVLERTKALENLNQELKRSNANLEEFAYAASHDMKEPIRKIHFFSDRIKNSLDGKLETEDARYFERLELATKRMSTLIDDLLMYSHISRGSVSEEIVDLNHVIAMVLEDLELDIEEKNAKIISDNLPIITGHKRQLQQLFQNLIGNSLKYSKPGINPEITITCSLISNKESVVTLLTERGTEGEGETERGSETVVKNFYLIEIKDNGIGFDQDDADRIFNVFTRLHGNAEYRGTGVGLSIVRKVAENHKGQIIADSQPGEGARFSLYLPA